MDRAHMPATLLPLPWLNAKGTPAPATAATVVPSSGARDDGASGHFANLLNAAQQTPIRPATTTPTPGSTLVAAARPRWASSSTFTQAATFQAPPVSQAAPPPPVQPTSPPPARQPATREGQSARAGASRGAEPERQADPKTAAGNAPPKAVGREGGARPANPAARAGKSAEVQPPGDERLARKAGRSEDAGRAADESAGLPGTEATRAEAASLDALEHPLGASASLGAGSGLANARAADTPTRDSATQGAAEAETSGTARSRGARHLTETSSTDATALLRDPLPAGAGAIEARAPGSDSAALKAGASVAGRPSIANAAELAAATDPWRARTTTLATDARYGEGAGLPTAPGVAGFTGLTSLTPSAGSTFGATSVAPSPSALAVASAADAGLREAAISAAPGSDGFAREVGAQITVFVREGVQQARLHLNPAEMGPVHVQIQLEGQAAQVHLAADWSSTRQALEQALPSLAGQLSEAGFSLAGGGISQQGSERFAQGDGQPEREATESTGQPSRGASPGSGGLASHDMAVGRARGLVDLVA